MRGRMIDLKLRLIHQTGGWSKMIRGSRWKAFKLVFGRLILRRYPAWAKAKQ